MLCSTSGSTSHEKPRQRLNPVTCRSSRPRKGKEILLIPFLMAFLGGMGLAGPALSDTAPGKSARSRLLGEWSLTLPLGDALGNPELVIYEKRNQLKGWMKGPRGKMRLKKVEAKGDQFTFSQVIPMGAKEIKLTFEGTIRDDRMQGVIKSKEFPKLPFKGVRTPPQD